MTLRFFFILIFFSFEENFAFSQNIFDAEHSLAYAQYLYKTGQYSQAAEEFERVVFFLPDSISCKSKLIAAYRKSGQNEMVLSRIHGLFGTNKSNYTHQISKTVLSILLEKEDTAEIAVCFRENINLELSQKIKFRFALAMLENNWKKAEIEFVKLPADFPKSSELKSILLRAQHTRLKNPALALGLSAAIPGLGKVYTRNYTDGLIVFSIVAVNAWQAYRGFRKEGRTSVYGWFFGSISGAFYLGNLYGATKAARKYNRNKIENIHEQVINIIISEE